MKHTTPYPQIQQSLVSILLAAGLIVSYNLNMPLAASPSARAGEHGTSSCSPGIPAAAMGTSELTLTAQGGHQVIVQQNNGSWQAKVHENLPRIGFCRTLDHLPVYIEEGLNWQRIAKLSEATQRQYVAVDFTLKKSETPAESKTPYVYIGRRDFPGASLQSLHEAVNQGYLSQVRQILNTEGIDINAVDAQGQSALHRAVIKGHTEIAALLIEAGADTTLQDHQGKTALAYTNDDNANCLLAIAKVLQLLSTSDDFIDANVATRIEQDLNEVQSLLDFLKGAKGEGAKEYRHLRYLQYRKIAYYLDALGKKEDASKHKEVAKTYKVYIDTTILLPPPLDEKGQEALATKITTSPERASSSTEDAEIQKNLNEISKEDLLPGATCDRVKALVDQACQSPSSFAHYISISATRDNLERLMHETIVECANAQAGEQAKTSNKRYIKCRKQSLAKLATLVRSAIDQNRLAFMQNALGCADDELRDLFFSNLLLTKENINRRYQELRQEFDPDKARWIPVMNQCTANELMTSINCCKDTLLQNLQTAVAAAGSKDTFYEEQGANFWAMAQDCRHAQKSEWNQLKIFTQADFAHLSKNASERVMILKQLHREHATHAYEAYRACCRVADANYARLSQLHLRSSMALCLYTAGRYLEAQLYALGAMRLIFVRYQQIIWQNLHLGIFCQNQRLISSAKENRNAILQFLPSAQQILAKVQRYTPEGETVPATDQGSTSAMLASTNFGSALGIRTESQKNVQDGDVKGAARIQGAIADDLSKIAKELTHKNDHSLVQYQAAEEDILQTSKCAVRYKIAGGAVMASGVVEGVACVTLGVASILKGAGVIAGTTLGGPVVAIVGGVGLIGCGICSSIALWKAGAALMKKPVMREKLNDIMQEALEHYGKGQSQKFLETLATAYAPGKWLFSLNDFRYRLPRKKISESLAEHGFRPDGIAYLFNLMGEALSSGQVEISDCLPSDMNFLADRGFYSSLSEELIDSATTLDGRIAEMRKKNLISMIKEGYRLFRDFFMLRDEGELAKEHVEDAQEMPFTVRLEEMRNIAKLNIAMISLVTDWETPKGDKAALDKTKKLVKEVRGSMDRYGQFHTMSANRLVAIEDFLWVVNGESIPNEVPSFIREPLLATPNQSHTERNMEGQQYLTYLNNRLVAVSSDQEKVKIYNQRAAYYVREAKKVAEANHSESLQYWQAAQTDYTNALMLMDHDQTACLGYARCLLGLSQYDQAFRYLKEHPNLQETPDCWIIASIAYRQQTNYKDAKKCILEALRQNPHNQEAAREKAVLEAATSPAVT